MSNYNSPPCSAAANTGNSRCTDPKDPRSLPRGKRRCPDLLHQIRVQFGEARPSDVHGMCDGFEMLRVDAGWIATKVVNHKAVSDGPNEVLVDLPMCQVFLPVDPDRAISPFGLSGTVPDPAWSFETLHGDCPQIICDLSAACSHPSSMALGKRKRIPFAYPTRRDRSVGDSRLFAASALAKHRRSVSKVSGS